MQACEEFMDDVDGFVDKLSRLFTQTGKSFPRERGKISLISRQRQTSESSEERGKGNFNFYSRFKKLWKLHLQESSFRLQCWLRRFMRNRKFSSAIVSLEHFSICNWTSQFPLQLEWISICGWLEDLPRSHYHVFDFRHTTRVYSCFVSKPFCVSKQVAA